MAWFKREKKRIEQPTPPDERRVKTEGLWTKCENCRTIVWKKDLEANWRVCPKCQHHFRLERHAAAGTAARFTLDRARRRAGLERSTAIHGHETLRRAAERCAPQTGHGRRDHHGGRFAQRTPGHLLLDGVRVHRRLDGRGGGRKSDSRDRNGHRQEDCRW